MGPGHCRPNRTPLSSLELPSMPTPTPTTLILHDSIPIGTDFIGSAAALPVSPAEPSQTVLGSDFAGGTVPLTAKVDDGEPAKQ
jgi:hypothetical protein